MSDFHQPQFTDEDLSNRFSYHAPKSESRAQAHTGVRSALYQVALRLATILPDGREKAVAMTKLEEVMFWANAALARTPDSE